MTEWTRRLAEHLAFYNGERPHQSLGYRTPNSVSADVNGGRDSVPDHFGRNAGFSPRSYKAVLFRCD
ncbi:integrase core domain-containing protein [Verrucomicrobium sp. 3C]|uniref:integrase core domain-containing protein n=1 Tax=Verrucomicrobium sp. 3C TaxID=1134055 RepID=UPI000366FB44|nr:integrase core domain-containing protein [Verrucomicrobium sp. 3C]